MSSAKTVAFLVALGLIVVIAPASERANADGDVRVNGDLSVPSDVYRNLRSDWGITAASPAPGTRPLISAVQARATAENEYGFVGSSKPSTHLVLLSDPDYGEAASEEAAGEDDATFVPLFMNHLAWLVVVRNATVPVLGPPGKRTSRATYDATIAVFVDARTGEDIEAVTLPPS